MAHKDRNLLEMAPNHSKMASIEKWRQNHSKMAPFKDGANSKKAPKTENFGTQ